MKYKGINWKLTPVKVPAIGIALPYTSHYVLEIKRIDPLNPHHGGQDETFYINKLNSKYNDYPWKQYVSLEDVLNKQFSINEAATWDALITHIVGEKIPERLKNEYIHQQEQILANQHPPSMGKPTSDFEEEITSLKETADIMMGDLDILNRFSGEIDYLINGDAPCASDTEAMLSWIKWQNEKAKRFDLIAPLIKQFLKIER